MQHRRDYRCALACESGLGLLGHRAHESQRVDYTAACVLAAFAISSVDARASRSNRAGWHGIRSRSASFAAKVVRE